ncbi:MAG: tripartite tricarboxylate transporter substrate binding protein [Pigmentiphaga sp.]|nr:tripartite tricarboxylate transporter substrate binding protein [Pigmentiphaga sp.]
MHRRTFTLGALALAALAGGGGLQAQENYPDKAITLLIPFPPGGGTDILSRLVATKLGEAKQWKVVPDNRGGAGGTIGITTATRAKPDGYTLVMGQKDNLAVGPWLYSGANYKPTEDLMPVAHVGYTPILIVTSAQSRFQTLQDVIDEARKAPDTITYGSPGNGTTIHLAGESFKNAANINIRHIPYKGSNPAMMDVLSGNVDLMVSSVPSAMAQIQAGALRPLAVTSARRSTSLPEVPTVAESGFPDFDVSTWYGVFAPAGTNAAVVGKLNAEINRLLEVPDVRAAVNAQGVEVEPLTPEAFGELLARDYRAAEDQVKAAGLKLE